MTEPEPYDYDTMSRKLRFPGQSYFKENWPKSLREKWLRGTSEEFRTWWLAEYGDWIAKVDRYHAEYEQRNQATYRPSPAFSNPAEPTGEDPDCE